MQLTERYRPKRISEFAGLVRAKAVMTRLVSNPYPTAFIFVGASGTGKTSLAVVAAEEMNAQIKHISSGNCDKQTVIDACDNCECMPMFGALHAIIVDECEKMSVAARDAWLSRLDCANPVNAVVFFTCNETKNLETRFLSRCKRIDFEAATGSEVSNFLFGVWVKETGTFEAPMMRELIEANAGNIRGALNALELELMLQPVAA